MIKRSNRFAMLEKLKNRPNWSVVDLGCGTAGSCEFANVLVDRNNHSSKFPNKKFVIHDVNSFPLPFSDNEFDFCWASHILEHVRQPIQFIEEITRISKRGYIEVPTPLIDNLVSGDDKNDPFGHKWWIYIDDENEKIIVRPRRHLLEKTVDIPELNMLYPFFRSSIVVEIYWEDTIQIEMGDEKYSYEDKEYDLSKDRLPTKILGHSRLKGAKK